MKLECQQEHVLTNNFFPLQPYITIMITIEKTRYTTCVIQLISFISEWSLNLSRTTMNTFLLILCISSTIAQFNKEHVISNPVGVISNQFPLFQSEAGMWAGAPRAPSALRDASLYCSRGKNTIMRWISCIFHHSLSGKIQICIWTQFSWIVSKFCKTYLKPECFIRVYPSSFLLLKWYWVSQNLPQICTASV